MSLANAAGVLLKAQTPLQQLLEDINFQRTKEMRQLLKDDSGFVVLQGTTYWTDLFVRHFLFQSEPVHSIDSDDLLFFVRKKHVKSSSRHMPKYETEVEVFRKDSRKLPIGDPDVDWEETVYLNMVIHQFDYTLTLAICTRTSPKELQVLRRHSQRVYASPSRRKMDTKGEGEEITYPHICYMVDNFDEVFSDILVRDGEMVCVELVANDKDGAVQGVIFLGSIRYDALKKVYDARQSSLSTKVAQRMTFGLFSSGAGVQTRCEFVRMKGPQGKGHAEMAVTKPKGSGVETPTSEPGFCATDMWDEWEEENEDYCTYRHQRRLSDPSANLNNFSRYGWRMKNAADGAAGSAGSKARSENEGLDSLASEVSEIEAGDLRDDQRTALSASVEKLHIDPQCPINKSPSKDHSTKSVNKENHSPTTEDILEADVAIDLTSPTTNTSKTVAGCGNCFGGKKCRQWVKSTEDKNTPQMSEVYCPSCDASNETPACLNQMPDPKTKAEHKSILSVESELIVSKKKESGLRMRERKAAAGGSILRSSSLSAADRKLPKKPLILRSKEKPKSIEKDKSKEPKDKTKLSKSSTATNFLAKVSPKRMRNKLNSAQSNTTKAAGKPASNNNSAAEQKKSEKVGCSTAEDSKEYEIADDATSLNGCTDVKEHKVKMVVLSDAALMIAVRGREELPVNETESSISVSSTSPTPPSTAEIDEASQAGRNKANKPFRFEKCVRVPVETGSHPLQANVDEQEKPTMTNDCNGNCNGLVTSLPTSPQSTQSEGEESSAGTAQRSTLPRSAQRATTLYNKALNLVPKRRTPDGTTIYYWCDIPKKALKELDDGAYNPLWASRGFTQSFHFWKENRRQQSTPLNAFLTYVTLPWWSIAKDLLDHRETPILTF